MVGGERRSLSGVHFHRLDLLPIQEHADLDGLGARGARARRHDPEEVFRIHGKAMEHVQRVGQAEPDLVVVEEHRGAGLDLGPHGLEAREGRLERVRAEEGGAGNPLRRLEVLLQEHGRDRQHVADIVEAVT